jgi:tetratricopeptide (TPR) repeat protein
MAAHPFLVEATAALRARDVSAAEHIYRRHAPALGGLAGSIDHAAQAAAILYDLGIDLGDEWRVDAAEEVFRRAIVLYAAAGDRAMEAAASNRLGILRLENGWLDEARACFQHAVNLRDALLVAHDGSDNAVYRGGVPCNLGNTAAAAFDFPSATAYYAQAEAALVDALAHGADRQTAERFLASTRLGAQRSAGRPATTLEDMFGIATQGQPPEGRGAAPWIDALVAASDPVGPAHHIAAAEPGTVRAHLCSGLLAGGFLAGPGWAEFHESAARDALAAFDAAIEIAPDDFAARLLKARLLAGWAAACQARARALTQAVGERFPAEEAQNLVDPVVRRFRGCWQRARESYYQSLRLAPGRADIWLEVGLFLREMTSHQEQEAMAAFHRALELDPALEQARAQLAGAAQA